jgi:hypothetical protein
LPAHRHDLREFSDQRWQARLVIAAMPGKVEHHVLRADPPCHPHGSAQPADPIARARHRPQPTGQRAMGTQSQRRTTVYPCAQIKSCVSIIRNLYKMFVEKDMAMLEINPFCVLKDGSLKLLDAKMGFDGNAMYRHPDILALRDEVGEFGPLLVAGQDWADVALSRRSMVLLAEKTMPIVNGALPTAMVAE